MLKWSLPFCALVILVFVGAAVFTDMALKIWPTPEDLHAQIKSLGYAEHAADEAVESAARPARDAPLFEPLSLPVAPGPMPGLVSPNDVSTALPEPNFPPLGASRLDPHDRLLGGDNPVGLAPPQVHVFNKRPVNQKLFGPGTPKLALGRPKPPAATFAPVSERPQLPVVALRAKVREIAQREIQRSNLIIELDTPMVVGRDYQVSFAMQAQDEAGATEEIGEFARSIAAPTIVEDTVNTTPVVKASLSSADFVVEEQKGGWQMVVPDGVTLWTWRVQPKQTGEKTLLFALSGKIQIDGQDYEVPVENYPRNVTVQVELTNIAAEAWRLVADNGWALIAGFFVLVSGAVSLHQLADRYRRKAPVVDSAQIRKSPAAQGLGKRPISKRGGKANPAGSG